MDFSYRLLQLLEKHVFEKITPRARLQRAINVFVSIIGGENDDACSRKLVPDQGNGVHAANDRHA